MMKKSKGITLVALIVTIIVLLILAGVSLNLIMGNDGILGRAENSANAYSEAQAREKLELVLADLSVDKFTNKDYNEEEFINERLTDEGISISEEDENKVKVEGWEFEIDRTVLKIVSIVGKAPEENLPDEPEKLPENTPETDAGTEVALKEGWATETMRYINVETGKEVTGLTQVATVYAVSDGQGNTVPVPLGFYYVGGTLESGVVISDNEADKNKYAGQADVPSGIEAVKGEDGTTITGITRTLKGNQFVWIPCSEETYKKYDWGTTYRDNIYSTEVTAAEKSQVQKYGGFYVGRYEAGLDENITVSTSTMSNTSTQYNVSGIPRIQAGIEPWNFIDYTNSKENAERLYSTSTTVNSGLLTGTMWDTMMYFRGDNSYTSSQVIKSIYGNYADTQSIITLGKTAYSYNSSGWKMDSFSTWKSGILKTSGTLGKNGYVWTTGSSEEGKLKNLYDVAGNIWERIEEISITNNAANTVYSSHHVSRGGCFVNSYLDYPACYRIGGENKSFVFNHGFRVALYIK